jgi:hypothetical protein
MFGKQMLQNLLFFLGMIFYSIQNIVKTQKL